MSDPFSTPRGGGRGGRGVSTPSPLAGRRGGGGGRGTPPGGRGGGRGIPDPFGTPSRAPPRILQTNPFVSPAAWSGWSSSSSAGVRGESSRGRRRVGIFGRAGRGGGGLFGPFGGRASAPGDDPFGGSSVPDDAERQTWLRRAKESFSNDSRFTAEKATVTASGMLLRIVEMMDAGQVPRRFVVKASFPEVAGWVVRERQWTHVSMIPAVPRFQHCYPMVVLEGKSRD
jgi:hypothetical protein